MNDNEYGRSTLRQTADGRSELVVSDKEDLIDVLKENAIGSDGQSIDQIRIVDEENGGSTKKNHLLRPCYARTEKDAHLVR